MPTIKKINHVAIVVEDMDDALSFWRDSLGLDLHELRDVPAEKSKVAFIPVRKKGKRERINFARN